MWWNPMLVERGGCPAAAARAAAESGKQSWLAEAKVELATGARVWTKTYGNPTGGKHQFAALADGGGDNIFEECWPIKAHGIAVRPFACADAKAGI